jgi:hypothetical protein
MSNSNWMLTGGVVGAAVYHSLGLPENVGIVAGASFGFYFGRVTCRVLDEDLPSFHPLGVAIIAGSLYASYARINSLSRYSSEKTAVVSAIAFMALAMSDTILFPEF